MNPGTETEKPYEISKTQSAECLDFRFRDGNRLAFPYSYMLKAAMNGAGELLITFSTDEVVVEGRNLDRVYPGIIEKRLLFLQEQDELAPEREKEVFVKKITVTARG